MPGILLPEFSDFTNGVLNGMNDSEKSHLIIVDSRGTLSAREWANELHPTGGGFKKIAKQAWEPILKAQNLA